MYSHIQYVKKISCESKSAPKIRTPLLNEGKQAPSVYAIRNRFRESNKHGRVARKIPFISKKNKQKRRQFYEEYILKPPNFCHAVLWTDESMIRLKYIDTQSQTTTYIQVYSTHL